MDYQLKYLRARLAEAGLPHSWQGIDYWQRTGKLTLRRRPNNWRVVNEEEIQQIIKEFSVGGSGEFHAK